MSGFEHFTENAAELEHEIAVRGVVLGIDWDDPVQVRSLAREALAGGAGHTEGLVKSDDLQQKARGELFALAVLMLRTMEESADTGLHTHGGPVWKAFGKALIEEAKLLPRPDAAAG